VKANIVAYTLYLDVADTRACEAAPDFDAWAAAWDRLS